MQHRLPDKFSLGYAKHRLPFNLMEIIRMPRNVGAVVIPHNLVAILASLSLPNLYDSPTSKEEDAT